MLPVIALFEGATPSITDITGQVGSVLTAVVGWMSSITSWIVGDPLALLFFALMLILFAVKMVLTLVHNA